MLLFRQFVSLTACQFSILRFFVFNFFRLQQPPNCRHIRGRNPVNISLNMFQMSAKSGRCGKALCVPENIYSVCLCACFPQYWWWKSTYAYIHIFFHKIINKIFAFLLKIKIISACAAFETETHSDRQTWSFVQQKNMNLNA